MQNIPGHTRSAIIEQNISYYDKIAAEYDHILDQDTSNEVIRQEVAKKFQETVQPGLVLDFGGGTGKDLLWLTEKGYRVIFCEPSSKMREKAANLNERNFLKPKVHFLADDQTDFMQWSNHLPFSEKTDAVLCNFAVINCIPDIKSLFHNLALVMKPGANLIALILDNSFKKMMNQSRRKALASAIFGLPFRFSVHSKRHSQVVYTHTDNAIRKASEKYFEFKRKDGLNNHGFFLIHLVKK